MALNDPPRASSSSNLVPGTRTLRSPPAIVCVARAMCRSGAVTMDANAAPSTRESTSARASTIAERLLALRKPAR